MPDFRFPKLPDVGFTFLVTPPFFTLELLEFVLKSRDFGFGLAERSALDGLEVEVCCFGLRIPGLGLDAF